MTDPIGDQPRLECDDAAAVLRFGADMCTKLRKNNHKAHWSTVGQLWLVSRLKVELYELENAISIKEDADAIIAECADVANFAMMIADNARNGHG